MTAWPQEPHCCLGCGQTGLRATPSPGSSTLPHEVTGAETLDPCPGKVTTGTAHTGHAPFPQIAP